MIKILHFSDAHIDMANHGKRDPESGLPYRVLDFLQALDTIVDRAIQEPVDLVIFAGDAYRDRTPAPTFQREWGRRMMRLSQAGVPTLLLVGNHDLSPAVGRAHALQEYDTLQIPHIHVVGKPCLLKPQDLEDLPVQIIALPWISRSGLLASQQISANEPGHIFEEIELRITQLVNGWLDTIDPLLPTILTAHASIQGAVFGGERSIMLGNDQILPGSLVKDARLDYVALGHIHKPQNLNENSHPPVVYPGSIERVDFGELQDEKYFVIAEIDKGETSVAWIPLEGRIFLDTHIDLRDFEPATLLEGSLPSPQELMDHIQTLLPDQEELSDSVARLTLSYPRGWESLIDDTWLHDYYSVTLENQIIRKPQLESRLRLGEDQAIASYTPAQLLEKYWQSSKVDPDEIKILQKMAQEIIYNQDESDGLGENN